MKTLARRREGVGGGGTERGVLVGYARCDFLHSRLSLVYNRNLPSCTLSLFSLTSSIVIPSVVKCIPKGLSVLTHELACPLYGTSSEYDVSLD